MSIVIGDVLRVVAILTWLDGNIMQNVFNSVISGTGGPFDDADIVADALEWVGDMFAFEVGRISDECDGSEIRVYIRDNVDEDWDEVGSDAWTFDPTSATDMLPRGVAGLINAKTLDPDVNGKKYVGGLTEDSSLDGLWSSGEIISLGNYGAEWVSNFTGGTSGASWVPGVWSPTRNNFFPFSGTIIVPTIPAYQRRRKRGVGI
jgi:hypothetical protein